MKDSVIRARVDASLKDESARVLAACGLEPSEAIRLFLRQVVVHGGIPFDVLGPAAHRAVPASQLRAMKRASQSRDRRIAARDDLSGGEMLLIRPDEARGAVVRWPSNSRK
jgi:DNA-damage-inducible protein J